MFRCGRRSREANLLEELLYIPHSRITAGSIDYWIKPPNERGGTDMDVRAISLIAMNTDPEMPDEGTELPADFAEHVATLTDLETNPATLEEWWDAASEQYSANNLTVGFDDLYSKTPTRHEVHVNGRIRYANCAMDALWAAQMEEQTTVTVRSIDPVAASPVTIEVGEEAVEVSPDGALICFGIDLDPADVEAVGSLAEWSVQDDKEEIRNSVCQYTNAFKSEDTYDQWAAATDCVSAPLPPTKLVHLQDIPTENS